MSDKKKPQVTTTKDDLFAHWRLEEMSNWDRSYMDEEVEAFLKIKRDGSGELRFGYVQVDCDGKFTQKDGKAQYEFTFEGNDEMDETSGRGHCHLEANGKMVGYICFHGGDDSTFSASKKAAPLPKKKKAHTSKP